MWFLVEKSSNSISNRRVTQTRFFTDVLDSNLLQKSLILNFGQFWSKSHSNSTFRWKLVNLSFCWNGTQTWFLLEKSLKLKFVVGKIFYTELFGNATTQTRFWVEKSLKLEFQPKSHFNSIFGRKANQTCFKKLLKLDFCSEFDFGKKVTHFKLLVQKSLKHEFFVEKSVKCNFVLKSYSD